MCEIPLLIKDFTKYFAQKRYFLVSNRASENSFYKKYLRKILLSEKLNTNKSAIRINLSIKKTRVTKKITETKFENEVWRI